jgi:hypothetical protein
LVSITSPTRGWGLFLTILVTLALLLHLIKSRTYARKTAILSIQIKVLRGIFHGNQ